MKKLYAVYYMKPEYFRDFNFGTKEPTLANLHKTHRFVRTIEAESLEEVFTEMQGERWSPNGEARDLISALGLGHTSMSVGDVVATGSTFYLVRPVGFVPLGK